MTVQSANELADLVRTLGTQFTQHHVDTNTLYTTVQQHLDHVESEAGQWITAEIRNLLSEWQQHLTALHQVEQWFENHVPNLGRIAEEAAKLAIETIG